MNMTEQTSANMFEHTYRQRIDSYVRLMNCTYSMRYASTIPKPESIRVFKRTSDNMNTLLKNECIEMR